MPDSISDASHSSRAPSPSRQAQQQATIRLGSPVLGNMFPQETSRPGSSGTGAGASPSPAGPSSAAAAGPATPIPRNPLSALNFPPGGPFGTPPRGTPSRIPTPSFGQHGNAAPISQYGSFDSRAPVEDPEIVRRHLVTDDDSGSIANNSDEEFSSLQLQGGDITRPIYRYVDAAGTPTRRARSMSFSHPTREDDEDGVGNIRHIKAIGGFRRDFLRRTQGPEALEGMKTEGKGFFTRNFIEFLTLHGHFAGEDLEDEEGWEDGGEINEGDVGDEERRPLMSRRASTVKMHKTKIATGTAGSGKAVLLLLKSFVGTGVLFLPKAYLNGGMVFSNLVLLAVSLLSYYCFVLLVKTRLKVVGSFGDIGGQLYGPSMRLLILFSIVISQIGFAAAYIVFTSENLQAFILAVSHRVIEIKYLILLQLIIFLPFSMVRDMAKLGFTALIADFFIMLGLVYLYYYDIFTLSTKGLADITSFNDNWTLFIGTAIFTFEGIGLIIPIQETMKHPEKFPKVLAGVMVVITAIFLSMGALCYASYGSETKTVVILNLPQDSAFVNAVQFLYSCAILLSTPLQLFPAIRIMESGLFPRSGKFNWRVKWTKNFFRYFVVVGTALIAWGGADDLDKFVAIIGSFACIPLVYIYPPLLYMKAMGSEIGRKERGMLWLLCAFGLAVMAYTTALTAWKWGDPSQ
ncbi:transmembrane amino acid transporter protein-domain-containing protein [Pyronema domesticum]|uniref:Similar to Vacuolar amino acid transporter 3 acc. no. Q10074 n=1 Tax=Pyronema omphalodes (strain CBS 100304) TaxID=1076935 RepID=U4L2N7_PYROM|nr:transmembrane amino acid transporter protein-domain-containing protein [Pyronema domesticum]CCX10174.1 Similar to Vacuolar amino acid transporter 3; acc. no. Q10074 [Pyronema omphalodes CBS 100304]